jgi:hypothetical protein
VKSRSDETHGYAAEKKHVREAGELVCSKNKRMRNPHVLLFAPL